MSREVRRVGGGRHWQGAERMSIIWLQEGMKRSVSGQRRTRGETGKREWNRREWEAHGQTEESFKRGELGWVIRKGVDSRKNWSLMWGHSLSAVKRGRSGIKEGLAGAMKRERGQCASEEAFGATRQEWLGVTKGLVWEGSAGEGPSKLWEKGENRGPGGSGVREEGADVGRGSPDFGGQGWREAAGAAERSRGSADLQRIVWKEARGRFSKLSPSRRQCSSRSSSGFAVPFMAPHGPRARTGALPARPPYELPAPASWRAVLPGHRSAAPRDSNRRPPGAGSKSPPRRVGGSLCGSKATGLPASGRYFRVRGGSGGGGAMAIEFRRDSEVLDAGLSRLRVFSRRLPNSVSEAWAWLRAECARPCPSRWS